MAVVYDPIRVSNLIERVADEMTMGWIGDKVDTSALALHAWERVDEAARLIESALEPSLHAYVGDKAVARVAVALALAEHEELVLDWLVDEELADIAKDAARAYRIDRERAAEQEQLGEFWQYL